MSDPDPTRRLPIVALLVANTVSLVGEALTAVAIPWFVYQTTGSAAQMGVVGFFTILSRVLSTFFGGAIIDQIGFKPISIMADVLSGLSVAAIPLLDHLVGLSFPLLLLLVFLGALFDGPGSTARESLLPDLAQMAGMPLERVNAFYQMVQRLALLIGPTLAGVLIAIVGVVNVLWVDAATFGFSVLVIGLLVPAIRIQRDVASDQGYWRDLASGLRFVRADRLLLWLVVLVATLNFFDAPLGSVLLPVFARTEFGSVQTLGYMGSMLGAGAVISSLIFAAVGARLPRHRTFVAAFLVVGLPYWLLASAPSLPLVMLGLFVMGFAAGPINPILKTVGQERVPEAIRARVFSAFTSAAWISIPLGHLAGGLAVDRFGTKMVFAGIAACYLLVTTMMTLASTLRTMDKRAMSLTARGTS